MPSNLQIDKGALPEKQKDSEVKFQGPEILGTKDDFSQCAN